MIENNSNFANIADRYANQKSSSEKMQRQLDNLSTSQVKQKIEIDHKDSYDPTSTPIAEFETYQEISNRSIGLESVSASINSPHTPYMVWMPNGWESYSGAVWVDDMYDPSTSEVYSGWSPQYSNWPPGWYTPDYFARPMETYISVSNIFNRNGFYWSADDFRVDIKNVFQKQLGRLPTNDETDLWNLVLNSGNMTLQQFSDHVSGWPAAQEYHAAHSSIQAARDTIEGIYWVYWGEPPDANANIWADRLYSGEWSRLQIIAAFNSSQKGYEQASFNAGHSLVYEDVETSTGLRQQVLLKDNIYGGMMLLGFVNEFDMRPYASLQSSYSPSDPIADEPVFPDYSLPVGTFKIDPAFLAYDASGSVVNDQRYTFVPKRESLQGQLSNPTSSPVVDAVWNGIASVSSSLRALLGVDTASMQSAQIQPAIVQEGVRSAIESIASTINSSIPTVYVSARGTSASGQWVFNKEVFYGVTKEGTPVFDAYGVPQTTIYLTATSLTYSQEMALAKGLGPLSAEAAAEWFPAVPGPLDPIDIGGGWFFNPKTGRLLLPDVSIIRDTRLTTFLKNEGGQIASANIQQLLNAANTYGIVDEIGDIAGRIVYANYMLMERASAPSSPISSNYDVENAAAWGLLKEQRVDRAITILAGKTNLLNETARRYNIDPRAIAAAITWEFSQNEQGIISDLYLPAGFDVFGLRQNGYGWGQIHDGTLRGEMISNLTLSQSLLLRRNLDSAIELVALRINQQATSYQNISTIDLRNNVEALTWMYNASADSVQNSARDRYNDILEGATPNLKIENPMAYWTKNNLQRFNFVTPTIPLPSFGTPYTYTNEPGTP